MSSDSFALRRLGPSDVKLLRALNGMFGAAFAEPDTYGAEPPTDVYLEGLLGRAQIIALVALQDEGVLGGLVAYELAKFERMRSEIYLYDLAVEAAYRRQGIATALIAQLRGIAAERVAEFVFIQADYGDDPAIALYDKLGVREAVLHFDIATEPG